MAEETATTPLDVAQPEQAPEMSFDEKLAAKLGFGEETEQPDTEPAEPSDEAPADGEDDGGETLDDPADGEESPDAEILIHNGQEKRVSKEQLRNLAQKGFDYEAQMTALKADKAKLGEFASALKARAEVQPEFVEALADYRAVTKQLEQWQNVDWMRLAQEEPLEWPKYQAQFQALQGQAQNAAKRVQDADAKRGRIEAVIDDAIKAREQEALFERNPEWKNEANFRKESPAILNAISEKFGFSLQELNQTKFDYPPIFDHRFITMARYARIGMEHVAAMKSGKNKLAQSPAASKPGVARVRDRGNEKAELTRKFQTAKDPQQKKQLLDAVLAKKLGF